MVAQLTVRTLTAEQRLTATVSAQGRSWHGADWNETGIQFTLRHAALVEGTQTSPATTDDDNAPTPAPHLATPPALSDGQPATEPDPVVSPPPSQTPPTTVPQTPSSPASPALSPMDVRATDPRYPFCFDTLVTSIGLGCADSSAASAGGCCGNPSPSGQFCSCPCSHSVRLILPSATTYVQSFALFFRIVA